MDWLSSEVLSSMGVVSKSENSISQQVLRENLIKSISFTFKKKPTKNLDINESTVLDVKPNSGNTPKLSIKSLLSLQKSYLASIKSLEDKNGDSLSIDRTDSLIKEIVKYKFISSLIEDNRKNSLNVQTNGDQIDNYNQKEEGREPGKDSKVKFITSIDIIKSLGILKVILYTYEPNR